MKNIILTGVNGGIGNACLKELLNAGFHVIGIDLSNESKETHDNYEYYSCDITNLDELKKISDKINMNIDAIVNMAGIFYFESIIEGNVEDLKRIINVNFFGAYNVNRTFLNKLNKGGKIINMSSEVAGYSPHPFDGYYSLSKILVDKYSDVLRRECNYLGIKVIKIQAGSFKTTLLDKANSEYDKFVENTVYFKKPLTKLKKIMSDELEKNHNPVIMGKKLVKIIEKKHNKIKYKVKRSFKLIILSWIPEKLQDKIYKVVIK